MKKIKKDIKDADLGDMIEEKFHCSDPKNRRTKVYLLLAEKEPTYRSRNFFICLDVEAGTEVVKDFTRTYKNITYRFVG